MSTQLAEITSSAFDLRWNLDPVVATGEGLAEYDGRYGNYTPADIAAHVAALRSVAGTLEAIDTVDLEQEIDRTALLGDVRVAVNRLRKEKPYERNPVVWLNHVLEGLYLLLVRTDRSRSHLAAAARSRLADIPRFLAEGRESLSDCPRVFVETALQISDGSAELITMVAQQLGPEEDPEFDRVVEKANEAFDTFSSYLSDDLLQESDNDFAIGEDAFNFRLHYEHALSNTAPELYRYGLRLVEEVEAEIADLARKMEWSGRWPDLVSRLRDDHPTAEDLVGAYEAEMLRSYEFVVERGLAPIPEGGLEVVETPQFLRPMIPYAAYQAPGAFSEDRRGLFFVSVPGNDVDATLSDLMLRDHCHHDLSTTALHEGYPGHHLQLLTAQANASPIRRVVGTPLMIEGWALYCEDMMAEEGFFRTPEEHLFQKVQLLWRAVRIVVDVGLHTRGMTFEEAIDIMVDRAGLERTNAEAEVRRYCSNPGYQLCYAVGRREIKALRTAYRSAKGSDFSLHEFHTGLLSYGGLPVNLARWGMGLDD